MVPARVAGALSAVLLASVAIAASNGSSRAARVTRADGGGGAPTAVSREAAGQQPCAMPQIPPVSREQNLFTPEQAVILGDVVMQQISREFKLVRDPGTNDYIQHIADRMAEVAGTGPVRVELIDLPFINALTLPGARVLVARKLVAFARSEDDVAGVLAHEFGHIVKRDAERGLSAQMRASLNVTSVGDHADIEEKYNRLIEARRTGSRRQAEKESDQEQLVADQLAVWLMARTGYRPQAYAEVWDRLNELKSSTGSWLSDFFGTTSPESRRLRASLQAAAQLPPSCVGTRATTGAQFTEWQQKAVEAARVAATASLHGVVSEQKLQPPLRSDLRQIVFSPDGKWVLAQDDNSLYLFKRDTFAFAFRIDAPSAYPAQFSSGSDAVVFYDEDYRVQRWNLAEARREWVRELVVTKRCLTEALSSDGALLACATTDFDLRILDVASGRVVFEKKNFYQVSPEDLVAIVRRAASDAGRSVPLFEMRFSPDLHYLIAARGRYSVAVDLSTRTVVSLPGAIRDRLGFSFAFLGNDRIVGIHPYERGESAIVTFPEGKIVTKLKVGLWTLEAPAHGDRYLLLRGAVPGYVVTVLDLTDDKVVFGTPRGGLDVYDESMVAEWKDGGIGLYSVSTLQPTKIAAVPIGPLGGLRAIGASADLGTLAISTTTRGGVWSTGDGRQKLLVAGFRGVYVDAGEQAYADFPRGETSQRAIVQLNAVNRSVVPLLGIEQPVGNARGTRKQDGELAVKATVVGVGLLQCGRYLGGWKETKNPTDPPIFVVYDALTGKEAWSRTLPRGASPYWRTDPRHDTLLFGWMYDDEGSKPILDANRRLRTEFEALKAKKEDVGVGEFIDLPTGTTQGYLLLYFANTNFRLMNPTRVGDTVVFEDNQNRTLVYSLKTGKQTGRAFGEALDVMNGGSVIAIENNDGQVSLYSLPQMEKIDDLVFPADVVFARFSPDGSELLVLTAEQTAYRLRVK